MNTNCEAQRALTLQQARNGESYTPHLEEQERIIGVPGGGTVLEKPCWAEKALFHCIVGSYPSTKRSIEALYNTIKASRRIYFCLELYVRAPNAFFKTLEVMAVETGVLRQFARDMQVVTSAITHLGVLEPLEHPDPFTGFMLWFRNSGSYPKAVRFVHSLTAHHHLAGQVMAAMVVVQIEKLEYDMNTVAVITHMLEGNTRPELEYIYKHNPWGSQFIRFVAHQPTEFSDSLFDDCCSVLESLTIPFDDVYYPNSPPIDVIEVESVFTRAVRFVRKYAGAEVSTVRIFSLPSLYRHLVSIGYAVTDKMTIADIQTTPLIDQIVKQDLALFNANVYETANFCTRHQCFPDESEFSVDYCFPAGTSRTFTPPSCHCNTSWQVIAPIDTPLVTSFDQRDPVLHSPPPDEAAFEDDIMADYDKIARRIFYRRKKKASNKRMHSLPKKKQKFVGPKRRIYDKNSGFTDMDPTVAAKALDAILINLWTANANRTWSVFVLAVYNVVKEVCPDLCVGVQVKDHIEWLRSEYHEFSELTWLEIADKVKTGLSGWEVFCTTRISDFLTTVLGYVSLFFFHPGAMMHLAKSDFDHLVYRFKTLKYNPKDVVTSFWGLLDDVFDVVKTYNETKSISLALVRDSPYMSLVSDIAKVRAYYDLFEAGNLMDSANMTEEEFLSFIQDVIDRIGKVSLGVSKPLQSSLMADLKNVTALYHKAVELAGSSLSRFRPYSYLLLGKSQIGKTVLNRRLVPALLQALGEKSSRDFIYSIKENVNFWDSFKTFMTGATYDDISNIIESPEAAKHLLRLVNNEPFNVEQAAIGLKGMVWCLIKVLGCTTNIPELDLTRQIHEVTAVMNRFNCHIEMEVKRKYAVIGENGEVGKLDTSKLPPEEQNKLFPDIHTFTIYTIDILSAENKVKTSFDEGIAPYKPDKYRRTIVEQDGVQLKDIDIHGLLRFLVADVLTHAVKQKALLATVKKLDDHFVCQTCNMPEDTCACNYRCTCDQPKFGGLIAPTCTCGRSVSEYNDAPYAHLRPDSTYDVTGLACCVRCEEDGLATCTCNHLSPSDRTANYMDFVATRDVDVGNFEVHAMCVQLYLYNQGKEAEQNLATLMDHPQVQPNSRLHYETSAEFNNNFLTYVLSRLQNVKAETSTIVNKAHDESNKFLIAMFEIYYRRLLGWVKSAHALWPIAMFDPDTPNYVQLISNTDWARNIKKWVVRVATVLCCVTSFLVSMCISTLWVRLVVGLVFTLIGRIAFTRAIYKTYDVLLRKGWVTYAYECFVNIKSKIRSWWHQYMDVHDVLFAEATAQTRATLVEYDESFKIAADIGPKTAKYVAFGNAVRQLIHAAKVFRATLGIVPNASVVGDLNEALANAHKYANPTFIQAYYDSLDEPDDVQNCHLLQALQKQTYAVTHNGVLHCQAVAVKTNILMVPTHGFIQGGKVQVIRRDLTNQAITNGMFNWTMDKQNILYSYGDVTFVNTPNVGTVKDLIRYFIQVKPASISYMDVVVREPSGVIMKHNGVFQTNEDGYQHTCNTVPAFSAFSYSARFGMPGYSGAPIVTTTHPAKIVGIHVGAEKGQGTYNHLGAWLESPGKVRDNMTSFISAPILPNAGVFPKTKYGSQTLLHGVSEKSIMFRLTQGQYKYLGRAPSLTPFNDLSGIVPTLITEEVYEEFGGVKYASPKLRGPDGKDNGLKWVNDLNQRSNPADSFPQTLVDRAVFDFLKAIPMPSSEDIEEFRPMNRFEVLNGRLGVHEMAAMNFNGSTGYPNPTKLKNVCVQEADGTYHFIDNSYWKEADAIMKCYANDTRAYTFHSMFPKIEPTDTTKDKVRMIVNPEIACKLVSRFVLLPILAYMERYRYSTECMVGINPYSQWDEFTRKFTRHKRCFAMDYSKYDLRMSAQIGIASYAVMAELSKRLKHPAENYNMILGLCADAMYPVIVVNGEVMMFYGSFTSGSVETSVRNSIANSLLLRIAYFIQLDKCLYWTRALYGETPFNRMVFLAVYGDDNAGDVSPMCTWFSMKSVQQALKPYGFVLTDANKSPVIPSFISFSKIDFLKRSSVHNKQTGKYVGGLTDESILKRLKAILAPQAPNTRKEITLQNIDSACDEWWYKGKKVYETNIAKLRRAVCKSSMKYGPPSLYMSYDERQEMLVARINSQA